MCIVLAVKVLIVISDLHTRKLQHIIESLSGIQSDRCEDYY